MPAGLEAVLVVPGAVLRTREARAALPAEVPMADAVFNIGRAALLVASLATGDLTALETATRDRLHSDRRLASSPSTRDAVDAMRRSGALATWLSGSGPTAAAFVERGTSAPVLASVAGNGTARVLTIDTTGARAE
jgi:homoserine kinase